MPQKAKKNRKYHNVGTVMQGEYGPFLVLGRTRSKDPKYDFDVLLRVQTPEGVKTLQVKNPLLYLNDPRRPNKEGTVRNVPENILYEVSFAETLEETE